MSEMVQATNPVVPSRAVWVLDQLYRDARSRYAVDQDLVGLALRLADAENLVSTAYSVDRAYLVATWHLQPRGEGC